MNAQVKPGYKQTEIGVIPEDWSAATVGEYFDIQLGKMLDAEKNTGVYKPYLGNRAVQWGRINISDLPTMAMTTADIARYRLKHGDLLVCEGGEVGRAAIWESPIAECYYQKALHRLRPIREFNTALMQALLQYWVNENLLSNFVTQTSIAHFPKEKFQIVPLPVPPAKEQKAIASALSDTDALISSLDQLIAKKRDIQQAAMQQLLTGQRRLPGFSGDWELKRLGEVFSISTGRSKSAYIATYGDHWIVDMGSVSTDGKLVVSKSTDFKADFLNAGDLVMPKDDIGGGGIIGRVGYIDADEIYVLSDHVYRLQANCGNPLFLSFAINGYRINSALRKKVIGSAQLGLSRKSVEEQEITLPSLEEQTAIANILSDMDTELAALKTRRDKASQLKEGMMQELLTGRTRLA